MNLDINAAHSDKAQKSPNDLLKDIENQNPALYQAIKKTVEAAVKTSENQPPFFTKPQDGVSFERTTSLNLVSHSQTTSIP